MRIYEWVDLCDRLAVEAISVTREQTRERARENS